MSDVGREAQQAFPPDVDTPEKQRRWELATRAVLITYGWDPNNPEEQLDSADRTLLIVAVRAAYEDESIGTGDGSVTDDQRRAMRSMGAL